MSKKGGKKRLTSLDDDMFDSPSYYDESDDDYRGGSSKKDKKNQRRQNRNDRYSNYDYADVDSYDDYSDDDYSSQDYYDSNSYNDYQDEDGKELDNEQEQYDQTRSSGSERLVQSALGQSVTDDSFKRSSMNENSNLDDMGDSSMFKPVTPVVESKESVAVSRPSYSFGGFSSAPPSKSSASADKTSLSNGVEHDGDNSREEAKRQQEEQAREEAKRQQEEQAREEAKRQKEEEKRQKEEQKRLEEERKKEEKERLRQEKEARRQEEEAERELQREEKRQKALNARKERIENLELEIVSLDEQIGNLSDSRGMFQLYWEECQDDDAKAKLREQSPEVYSGYCELINLEEQKARIQLELYREQREGELEDPEILNGLIEEANSQIEQLKSERKKYLSKPFFLVVFWNGVCKFFTFPFTIFKGRSKSEDEDLSERDNNAGEGEELHEKPTKRFSFRMKNAKPSHDELVDSYNDSTDDVALSEDYVEDQASVGRNWIKIARGAVGVAIACSLFLAIGYSGFLFYKGQKEGDASKKQAVATAKEKTDKDNKFADVEIKNNSNQKESNPEEQKRSWLSKITDKFAFGAKKDSKKSSSDKLAQQKDKEDKEGKSSVASEKKASSDSTAVAMLAGQTDKKDSNGNISADKATTKIDTSTSIAMADTDRLREEFREELNDLNETEIESDQDATIADSLQDETTDNILAEDSEDASTNESLVGQVEDDSAMSIIADNESYDELVDEDNALPVDEHISVASTAVNDSNDEMSSSSSYPTNLPNISDVNDTFGGTSVRTDDSLLADYAGDASSDSDVSNTTNALDSEYLAGSTLELASPSSSTGADWGDDNLTVAGTTASASGSDQILTLSENSWTNSELSAGSDSLLDDMVDGVLDDGSANADLSSPSDLALDNGSLDVVNESNSDLLLGEQNSQSFASTGNGLNNQQNSLLNGQTSSSWDSFDEGLGNDSQINVSSSLDATVMDNSTLDDSNLNDLTSELDASSLSGISQVDTSLDLTLNDSVGASELGDGLDSDLVSNTHSNSVLNSNELGARVSNDLNSLSEQISGSLNDYSEQVTAFSSQLSDSADGLQKDIQVGLDSFNERLSNGAEQIQTWTNQVSNDLNTTVGGLSSGVANAVGDVQETLDDAYSSISNTVSNAYDSAKDVLQSTRDNLKNDYQNIRNTLSDSLTGTIVSENRTDIGLEHNVRDSFSLMNANTNNSGENGQQNVLSNNPVGQMETLDLDTTGLDAVANTELDATYSSGSDFGTNMLLGTSGESIPGANSLTQTADTLSSNNLLDEQDSTGLSVETGIVSAIPTSRSNLASKDNLEASRNATTGVANLVNGNNSTGSNVYTDNTNSYNTYRSDSKTPNTDDGSVATANAPQLTNSYNFAPSSEANNSTTSYSTPPAYLPYSPRTESRNNVNSGYQAYGVQNNGYELPSYVDNNDGRVNNNVDYYSSRNNLDNSNVANAYSINRNSDGYGVNYGNNRYETNTVPYRGMNIRNDGGIAPRYVLEPTNSNDRESRNYARTSSSRVPYREYVTKEGDNLLTIAQNELGSSSRWTEIKRLNNLRSGATYFEVGTKIKLPVSTTR